ncbi:MAG: 5'-methylthioadenosine/adenosylhomocysteine nucleosidase [Defluviitaleaceae bacterium]|nr:5'-methylthioadenosine/adenosylhomocysteine nucleosidase [Defluviitaleaceae bacterium]MCL2274611.1 5'-methylthioadenosine/adenosylhomocysteine nucleosidase [Defluviitaleaceae bacterium]
MKLGIIGPCDDEINPFLRHLTDATIENHAMLDFHRGKYATIDIVAVRCGVCKVNAAIAAQLLISRYGVTHLIVTGAAGAICQELAIYDTVIASDIAYHDVHEGILTEHHPWMETVYFKADAVLLDTILRANANDPTVKTGRIVTGEAFIDVDGRDTIINDHAPLCVDMETAAVAHVCYANGIPFAAIRSISDTPHESGAENMDKYFTQAGEKSVQVLLRYLATCHP